MSRVLTVGFVVALTAVLMLSGCTGQSPAPSSQPSTSQQPSSTSAGTQTQSAPAAAPAPPAPKPIVIPAGTVLNVRLGHAVGSKISQAGQRFDATIAEPVTVDDKTAIPTGTEASGKITDAKAAGRFKGGASLALALDAIYIKGRKYAVETAAVTQTSKGKGKRTAGMIVGGAGAGALIGGLAGGGKGAAIGAAVGAGAGTAGAAFTGNRDITLEAEAPVSFELLQDLTLEPASGE